MIKYADLIVHRQLQAALDIDSTPVSNLSALKSILATIPDKRNLDEVSHLFIFYIFIIFLERYYIVILL